MENNYLSYSQEELKYAKIRISGGILWDTILTLL